MCIDAEERWLLTNDFLTIGDLLINKFGPLSTNSIVFLKIIHKIEK